MSGRPPISGVVTTFNNDATLDACLASLAFCDERVVLDSGSTDATVEIARRHGARIAEHPFAGYGPQKQRAIDMARHDWILLLDADEPARERARPAMWALAVTVFPFNTHLAFYSTFWGGLTLLLAALYAGSLLARE